MDTQNNYENMTLQKRREEIRRKHKRRQRLTMSLLIMILSIVAMTAATVAWFTIADRGRVDSMLLDVTSGTSIKFDLDGHQRFDEYIKTLQFTQIAARIQREHGFDMRNVPLEPVTTKDYKRFHFEDGSSAKPNSGAYLEFKLHFMGLEDMKVNLTGENGEDGDKGTAVTSKNKKLPPAMRIAFTADGKTVLYDPGKGLGGGAGMYLFDLKKETDKEVTVHIWLEGTDENCTSEIKGSDYSISLRFIGTDKNGNVIGKR